MSRPGGITSPRIWSTSKGRYEYKGKYISYDRPGTSTRTWISTASDRRHFQRPDDDRHSRDGLSVDLFPLTASQQRKYNFKLLGKESFRGARRVPCGL